MSGIKYCPKCDTELHPVRFRKTPVPDWDCPKCGITWTWDQLDTYIQLDRWNAKVRKGWPKVEVTE